MTEEEYKQEWLNGMHQTEYNACRFSEDKIAFCKQWLDINTPWVNYTNPKTIVDLICKQKIKIASDETYRKLCADWTDKINAYNKLQGSEIQKPAYFTSYDKLTAQQVNSLPNKKLIIKCAHGSGWNIIFDKSNGQQIPIHMVNKINEWQELNYAYITGYEAQYESIKGGVIIEPVLIDKPTDYGFWCINGEIKGVSLTRKLGKNLEEYLAFVNPDGTQCSWRIGIETAQDNLNKKQKEMVNAMIPYVKELAKPFDFVRVDMFYINGHIYFGELTFTPCSGRLDYVEV